MTFAFLNSMLPILHILCFATGSVFAKVQFAGMNIAGLEFGCDMNGTCDTTEIAPPLSALNGRDGAGQMQHFTTDGQLNMFRLPVGWQFLVNHTLGGPLDATNFGDYDQLVQACLATGSSCIIDIHNYARFNGKIIAQDDDGPTDAQFADIWSQLAVKYKNESKIVFGIMNEPHDLNITTWASSVQAAVTAIRSVGAVDQIILLPGNDFSSARGFIENGSAAALSLVSNPDGTNTSLIFDVHQYLDTDNTGTHAECTTDHINDTFVPLAAFLKANGRQAILSETGGGNTTSCLINLCAETTFLNNNPDVFLGYIGWAAGSFDSTYLLSETPTMGKDGKYADAVLTTQCIIGTRNNGHALMPHFTMIAFIFSVLLLIST